MKKSDRTKAYIIEKVAPIFNKKGVYGTSLSDMTDVTGLTKGAIYGNFASKDALAMACFEYNLRFLQKGLYKSIAINGSAIDKLGALVNFYQQHYGDVAENGGCPLMNSAIETDDAHPLLRDKVQTTFSLWRKEITSIVVESQRKMEINPLADPSRFSNTFIAMLEGGILVAKTMDSPEYFNEVTNSLLTFIQSNLEIKNHA
ncbi:hypothetical protein BFP97_09990 [Roseivirga sp. 4D4]|uniref:TetR/AcrR family transcriptional regulator n=1 Tax=Roseivirga sp. 4D4 TaxID=1889784 RepID=UPI000853DE47|nr:TetR/AcrR family transcriptional regulator [Roseivirga sp. 4D4]OEK01825.1 hypothetical protein BFP97_09990 [Roseivirga sp. 4D4]